MEQQTQVCQTCWAVVVSAMAETHRKWHENIANVAIENTEQIEILIREAHPECRRGR